MERQFFRNLHTGQIVATQTVRVDDGGATIVSTVPAAAEDVRAAFPQGVPEFDVTASYPGGRLCDVIDKLTTKQKTSIALDIACQLSHLHGMGMFHGDVQPSNVGLNLDRTHCLLLNRGDKQDRPNPYWSPSRPFDGPSASDDVWALGVMIHELFAGEFDPPAARQFSYGTVNVKVEKPLAAVVTGCLAAQANRMPMHEILQILDGLVSTGHHRKYAVVVEGAAGRRTEVGQMTPAEIREQGLRHLLGAGVVQDDWAGFEMIEVAAKANDALALRYLSGCLMKGIGCNVNESEGRKSLAKAQEIEKALIDSGDFDAMVNAALAEADAAKALDLLRAAADGGHAAARRLAGFRLTEGVGCKQDIPAGVDLLRNAAQSRDYEALVALGEKYLKDPVVLREARGHLDVAFSVAREKAMGGDVRAMGWLGDCYRAGRGTAPDVSEAARWFRKGADGGDPFSMNCLIACYKNGVGVARDQVEADLLSQQLASRMVREKRLESFRAPAVIEGSILVPIPKPVAAGAWNSVAGEFYDQIVSWLPQLKEGLRLVCLWRARGAFSYQGFHDVCDMQGATVTIIKSQRGNLFGAYTPISWDRTRHGNCQGESSNSSFIFVLKSNNSGPNKTGSPQNGNHVYHHYQYGPAFGNGSDLYVNYDGNFSMSQSTYSSNPMVSYCEGGNSSGSVANIEVWAIRSREA